MWSYNQEADEHGFLVGFIGLLLGQSTLQIGVIQRGISAVTISVLLVGGDDNAFRLLASAFKAPGLPLELESFLVQLGLGAGKLHDE